MKIVVVERRQQPPVPGPLLILERDRWDDYGFKCMFQLSILRDGVTTLIGDIKIMQGGQESGPTMLPSTSFDRLGDEYCSLGQSFSYYEVLHDMGLAFAIEVLQALRDVVAVPGLLAEFQPEEVFQTSLLREGSAERALRDAPALFRTTSSPIVPKPSAFAFHTSVGGHDFSIPFEFDDDADIPSRVNVVIGYNGSGKTRLLANLAMVASADLRARMDPEIIHEYGHFLDPNSKIRFGAIITVSYSAFDTFRLPDDSGSSEVRQRVADRGELFGHVYAGLRKRPTNPSTTTSDPQTNITWLLKSIDELTSEFRAALEKASKSAGARRELLLRVLEQLSHEPSFERIGIRELGDESNPDRWAGMFSSFSTGHKIVLNILVQVIAHLQRRSLVVLDEPESHLHPPLLAAMLRALAETLRAYSSYAVIATHSPVVLQEVPRRYVRVLRRFGDITRVHTPEIETFGENVGTITRTVFDLDNSASDYHVTLRSLAQAHSLEEIERLFGSELGTQALAYILAEQGSPD